jgi:hypothetical protein
MTRWITLRAGLSLSLLKRKLVRRWGWVRPYARKAR